MTRRTRILLAIPLLMATVAAKKIDTVPSQLDSASAMTEDARKRESWTYRDPAANFATYRQFKVAPTAIYRGPEGQWGKSTEAEKQRYASLLTTGLSEGIAKEYPVVAKAGAGTAVLRITLLGIEKPYSAVATVSKLTPIGFVANGVKSVAGSKGTFSGSVLLSLEIVDGATGKLLYAGVRRRAPDALDIKGSTSTDNTVRAVARDVAEAVRKGLKAPPA